MGCPFSFEDRAITNNVETGEPELTSYSYDACKLINTTMFGQSECVMNRNGGNRCVGEDRCPIVKK